MRRFRAFVDSARPLVATRLAPALDDAQRSARFRAFVEAATPLATLHARTVIDRLAPIARTINPWIVAYDLLDVAGYAYVETAYTSLVAWALFPPGRPEVALAVQRRWAAEVAPAANVSGAARPDHQLITDDGIPDLVFVYDDSVIVVEAKTKTVEHAAPSGRAQTFAYRDSVIAHLGPEHAWKRCEVIYLTPDGSAPANPAARSASYAQLAIVLADALDDLPATDALRQPYAMLITHLLMRSLPARVDAVATFEQIRRWHVAPRTANGSEILAALSALHVLGSLFPSKGDI